LAEYEASELESQFNVAQALATEARAKEDKAERLTNKYKEKTLTGRVRYWNKGYGFLSGDGESEELGSVFLHLSKVTNKTNTFFKKGVPVKFGVEYDAVHDNFRATWAEGQVPLIM
jgi:cold shock CspA family protein